MSITKNQDLEYIQKMILILNKIRDCKTQREFLEILRESHNKLKTIDEYYALLFGNEVE